VVEGQHCLAYLIFDDHELSWRGSAPGLESLLLGLGAFWRPFREGLGSPAVVSKAGANCTPRNPFETLGKLQIPYGQL